MRAIVFAATVLVFPACTGTIGDPGTSPGEEEKRPPSGGDEPVVCTPATPPPPTPAVVRLTHVQYDNTVRALFELPSSEVPSASFIADPSFAGFDNNAAGLLVNERLTRDYRRAAEQLSAAAAADAALLARLLPCDTAGQNETCARNFIRTFGRRAYRRPLSDRDVERMYALFQEGANGYTEGTPFVRGVRLVIEAVLQSPRFLYRLELSSASPGEVQLDGHELASRLSYMLWNAPPDDELFAAADSGMLLDAPILEAQARRLLEDPRAQAPVADFHAQWLALERYRGLQKNAQLYPEFDSEQFGDSMTNETQAFIRNVILETRGDFRSLMTASYTIADATLAPIYGAVSEAGAAQRIDLDRAQRAGLFTQTGFLASHAFTDISSPIHRGVFLHRNVICNAIADPPGNADLNLPPIQGEIKTTRQQVTVHTSPDACAPCHSQINQAGFAFEHYDAIGRWRDTENGEVIDSSGSIAVGSRSVAFTDAVDLAGKLAEEEQVRRCYLTHWFRYGYARKEAPEDQCTIDQLHDTVQATDYNLHEMLVAMTLTRSFRYRSATEDAQ